MFETVLPETVFGPFPKKKGWFSKVHFAALAGPWSPWLPWFRVRVRQRSKEGVVRGSGRPKGCFWRVRLFSAPVKFALKTPETLTQRALRDRLMSRGKNCLPTVSRQFLTRNYPRPNCLLKCLPNCLAPKRRLFILFQNYPRGEGNCETSERQKLSRGNFCPATSICLFWPTGQVGREEPDSPKHPFGRPFLRTTPSPLLWRTAIECEERTTPFLNTPLSAFRLPCKTKMFFQMSTCG